MLISKYNLRTQKSKLLLLNKGEKMTRMVIFTRSICSHHIKCLNNKKVELGGICPPTFFPYAGQSKKGKNIYFRDESDCVFSVARDLGATIIEA